MNRFVTSFWAQWQEIRSDRAASLLLFGAFVLYALLFPLPYQAQVATRNPIAVVDLDQSSLSRQLVRLAQASGALTVTQEHREVGPAADALQAGEVAGLLVIPAGFHRDTLAGRAPVLAWAGDATYLGTYRQVATALATATGQLSAGIKFRHTLARGQGVEAARVDLLPVQYVARPLFNVREGSGAYAVPAVMILVMQQTLLMGIGLLLGTARKRGPPGVPRSAADTTATLLGRATPFVLIYGGHTLLLYGVVSWFWDLPRFGQLAGGLLFLLPYLIACTFLGFALGALFRERETALIAIGISSMPVAYIAGFAWPHEALFWPLRALSWLIPSTAGIQGSMQLMQMGASWTEVAPRWAALWGLAGLYAVPAWRTLRRSPL